MVFNAGISGGETNGGIFLMLSGEVRPIVLSGDTAPGTEGGVFAGFSTPQVTQAGTVAFWARMEGGSSGTGIYLYRDGQLIAVALQNQLIPDTQLALMSLGNYAVNDLDQVVFEASIFTNDHGNTQGVFMTAEDKDEAHKLTAIAFPGNVVKDSSETSYLGRPDINNNGDVVLIDYRRGLRNALVGHKVILYQSGKLLAVSKYGDSIDESAQTRFISSSRHDGFIRAAINSAGDIAYISGIEDELADQALVFRGNTPGATNTAIDVRGRSVDHDLRLIHLASVALTDTGGLLYRAKLSPVYSESRKTLDALFLSFQDTRSLVAMKGDVIPPMQGAITKIKHAAANNLGYIVLVCSTDVPADAILAAN